MCLLHLHLHAPSPPLVLQAETIPNIEHQNGISPASLALQLQDSRDDFQRSLDKLNTKIETIIEKSADKMATQIDIRNQL